VLGTVRGEADTNSGSRSRAPSMQSVAVIATAATIAAAIAVSFAVSQRPSVQSSRAGARPAAAARMPLAVLHESAGRAELIVSSMPEPPIGEVYEVWLNGPGARPRATDALFTVTSAGNGSVEVPGSLHGVREVMVTSEPLGGSSSPTSLAVLRVRVASRR
jgi:anti-sigma-K factor RskA